MNRKQPICPPSLTPGDQVAVLSPSAGLPEVFPWVQDLGLKRIRSELDLYPREYPTTRNMNASLKNRAKDIMNAFSDPSIKAIFTSIGGSDQIQLLKYLDPDVIRRNPKWFVGYSDNTHLHHYLTSLNIMSLYGPAVMTQFAMQGGTHSMTLDSLRRALFTGGEYKLPQATEFTEVSLDWSEPSNLEKDREMTINEGWVWDGSLDVRGYLWGGCVESLVVRMSSGQLLPAENDYQDMVLFLETAEDIPDHWITEYILVGFGERGWLENIKGVLVGRAKAWEFDRQLSPSERAQYRTQQQSTVLDAVRTYNRQVPVVQNLDFGHTDPQLTLPVGGEVRIDSSNQTITVYYGPNT